MSTSEQQIDYSEKTESEIAELFKKELENCRVPGTDHEYFDCCFSLSHSTCKTFGLT